MFPVGAWVEGKEVISFLQRLNLPLLRVQGPEDPALNEIQALILEATLPTPAFEGSIFRIGEKAFPLNAEGAKRLLRALGPYYLPFFKTLLENVRDIVYVVDEKGRAYFTNAQVADLGFKPLEPGERVDLLAYLSPADRPLAEEALASLLTAPDKTRSVLLQSRDASGTFRFVRVWGRNLRHLPEVGGILLNVRDVSEEVHLRQRLAEEAARLEALIAALPGVVLQSQPAPEADPIRAPLHFLSPQARAVLGHPPEAFRETPGLFLQITHPDDRGALAEAARQAVVQPGKVQTLVHRFFHGKARRWVWLRSTLRYDERTRLLTGFTQDVGEEVARAKAVAESERRFRTLAETAPALIVIWQNERLVFINRAGLELTGYTEEELKSRPIWDFVHPEDRETVKKRALARLRGEAVPQRYTFRIVTKTGETRWLDYSAAGVEIDGAPAVLGVGLDVTEAKERELDLELFALLAEALHQSDGVAAKLEAALQVVTEFFRAPAGAILLYREGRVWARARRGWVSEVPPTPRLEEKSLAAAALAEGRPIVVADLKKELRLRPEALAHVPAGWSGVAVPLRAGCATVGVLFLARPGPPPGPRVVLRIERAAETIGNAVQRAALRGRLATQVADLAAIAEAGRAAARNADFEESARILLRALLRLPFDGAAVFSLEDDHPRLRVALGDLSEDPALAERLAQSPTYLHPEGRPLVRPLDTPTEPLERWAKAEGYAEIWALPLFALDRQLGVLLAFARERIELFSEDRSFLETVAAELEVVLESARRFEEVVRARAELADAYEKTLWGWAKAVELRDQETAGHTERVTALAEALGRALGLSPLELADLRRGAILHDVGKLAIPDVILRKPGELSDAEWSELKKHPIYAYEWLKNIPYLQRAIDVPHYHHERWNGSGYPEGLKGEAIPLLARIFAVADVYDALTSDRPYRKALPREQALRYLETHAGELFDPRVVAAFLRLAEVQTV